MANALKVEYRRLGKSGLRVSVPILGAMSYGSDKWAPWVLNEDKALPLLKAAWDMGINTWDTANVYSNGESERILAKAIKKYDLPRHKVVLLTKCWGAVGDHPGSHGEDKNSKDFANQYGLSRAAIFNAVDASLARLETSYIDLLQIHRADASVPAEETMQALHDLVRSGKVRYIGASSMWTWQFQHYNHVSISRGLTPFVSMQNFHSLLYREEEREMMKYCEFAGVGVIPWGPLNNGLLARPFQPDSSGTVREQSMQAMGFELKKTKADEEIIKRVEKMAKEKGWSMAQVALAWSCAKVSSPIVGLSSVKRIEEAIIPEKKLTEEEMKHLEEPYVPKATFGFS